ncbi:MAG TPA: hypothetical protein VK021_09030, partial [Flavobacteriaceae bacterium]|nr:hypothetical protein [Flavobacteriaceae bacterium]
MTVDIHSIYYENTNEPKTILNNGVVVGSEFANVYFKEMESISLLDDFKINGEKNKCHLSGNLHTDGHKMTVYDFLVTGNATLNLSSSDIFIKNTFHSNSANVEINPDTSHLHFTGIEGVFSPYSGQSFHKVSFEKIYSDYLMDGDYNQNNENPVTFHEVTFFGNGDIEGYNEFENLILNGPRI